MPGSSECECGTCQLRASAYSHLGGSFVEGPLLSVSSVLPSEGLGSCETSSPTSCLRETRLPVCPRLAGKGNWVPTGRHLFAHAHLILWCLLPYPCTQPYLVFLISETLHLPSPENTSPDFCGGCGTR